MNRAFTTICKRVNPGEIYMHYKGPQYKVLHIAKHTETEEDLVVYQRVSPPDNQVWVRPLDMFTESVSIDNVDKPRFTLVEQK